MSGINRAIESAHEAGDLPFLRSLDRAGLLLPGSKLDDVNAGRVADIVCRVALLPIEPGRPLVGVWIKPVRLVERGAKPAFRSPAHQARIDRHVPTYVNCAMGDSRAVGWRWQIAGTIGKTNRAKADPAVAAWKGMPFAGWQWFTAAPAPTPELCVASLRARILDRSKAQGWPNGKKTAAMGWIEELARRLLVDLEKAPVRAPVGPQGTLFGGVDRTMADG